MSFIQILDCNTTLGECCSDRSLVTILDSARKILDIIQLAVPIMLIIWATFEFIKMMQNPEDNKGMKSLINKFLAAGFVFFIPLVVNIVLSFMPSTFNLTACWKEAKVSSEVLHSANYEYIPIDDEKKLSVVPDSSKYEKGNPEENHNTGTGNNYGAVRTGSATGQAIVEYAKSFVGNPYVFGGTWNGERPYTPTDCSGFVQGVFRHHGIILQRDTASQWADTSMYTLVNPNDIRPADLIMYVGHVGILTGNGTELVHAKGSNYGIALDPDYRYSSAIRGIMRIKGVN